MMSRRGKFVLSTSVLVSITLCMVILYDNPTLNPIRQYVPEGRIYGRDQNCKAYISANRINNIKRLLSIKTTPEVEDHLHRLGYPNRNTTSGDVYIPNLPDPNIPVPRIPVIVAGASSNHFTEMQAMMHNIDTVLRPVYPNIKVILYDIGFTEAQRQAIIKYGRCKLRKFDFAKYPDHIKYLHSCAWKPIIIQEVLNEYKFTMYMDASIRLNNGSLTSSFNKVKELGLLHHYSRTYRITTNTYAETFEYFNVEPCLLHGLFETGAGLNLVVKNNLYSYAIMRAWLTCCLQRYCVEPKGSKCQDACNSSKGYHNCHRFDQSALGIAISMTALNESHGLPGHLYKVKRGHHMDYFKKNSKGIIRPKPGGKTDYLKKNSKGIIRPKPGGKTDYFKKNSKGIIRQKPGGKTGHKAK